MVKEPADPHPDSDEDEDGGPIKSFLEHLEDLRWVFIKCLSALLIGLVACLAAAPQLLSILQRPLKQSGAPITLQIFGPIGSVTVSLKVALYGGLTLSLPFILYFIAQFVVPALKKNEKKYFVRAFIVGTGLFLAGVIMCYFFVLKISLWGMSQYAAWLGLPAEIWRAEEYFQFVTLFMMGMGVSFEFPVILLTLVKMGLLEHRTLVKSRPYLFIIIFSLCAFITPDFISTFFMVIPVLVLMEICILISGHWERQKRRAAEAEASIEASHQAR